MEPSAVFIVEDSPEVVDRIQRRLSELVSVVVLGSASDLVEAELTICSLLPEICIVDVQVGRQLTLPLVQRLMQLRWPPAVVVFTHHVAPPIQRRYELAGVAGFFDKTRDSEAMFELVQQLALTRCTQSEAANESAPAARHSVKP